MRLRPEITDAIAKGNVVPAAVPALKAMVQQQAKAELVDGKVCPCGSATNLPANSSRRSLSGDDGKAFRAAGGNSGGGAPGGLAAVRPRR